MIRALLLLLLASQAWGAWPNGYTYRRDFTVAAAQVPSTQTNFPAVVNVVDATLATVANGGHVQATCAQSAPSVTAPCDLIFTDTSDVVLPFEIEKYVASTGELVAWVQVPSIATATVVRMYYGKSGVSSFQGDVTGTWDSHFKEVHHLRDGSTLDVADSTGNHAATNNSATATTGQVDGAAAFGGSATITTATNIGITGDAARTICMWINPASSSGRQSLLGWGNADIAQMFIPEYNGFRGGPNNIYVSGFDNDFYTEAVLSTGVWSHVCVSYAGGGNDPTNSKIYYNGASQAIATFGDSRGAYATADGTATIGRDAALNRQPYTGSLDEIRISDVARSADWIATEFNNQSAPETFWPMGPEQTNSGATSARRRIIE